MKPIKQYIADNMPRFVEEWGSLVGIPSVSCQPEHKQDMLRCAEQWKRLLLEAGAQHAEIMPSDGNPVHHSSPPLLTPDKLCNNKCNRTILMFSRVANFLKSLYVHRGISSGFLN